MGSDGCYRVESRPPLIFKKSRTVAYNRPSVASVGVSAQSAKNGGGSGIRTHETVTRLPVFKTGAFNRSAIPPGIDFVSFFGFCAPLDLGVATILLPNAFYGFAFTAPRIAASTCSAASACIPGMTCE